MTLRRATIVPGWIVNLTNDGWFGISTGPYQHLQQVRLRAIEEGLPVARAANTGISAVIDPMGRVVAELGLGLEGVLDSRLPSAIPPTIYTARRRHSRRRFWSPPALILVISAAHGETNLLTRGDSSLILDTGRKRGMRHARRLTDRRSFAIWPQ